MEDVYNIKEYEKSQAYKLTNYRFGILTSTFSLALILGFIVFGGFNWVDQIAQNSTDHPIGQALLFFGIILLGSDIINIPFTYYQTFVIEEKIWVQQNNTKTFILDKIKQWALTLIVGGGILALIIWFFRPQHKFLVVHLDCHCIFYLNR
ncbi:hypothetical protein Q2T40_00835 [Winogradskyella maritima]|nr:hypothetical protein [Winogradskyella maritima]